MNSPGVTRHLIRFGPFGLNLETGELHKGGLTVRLQQQPLEVLKTLLARRGGLVTREELRERLWPDGTIVDFDHSLNTAVRKLRQALEDDPDHPRFLETLPRRGYRLIVPVAQADELQPRSLPRVLSLVASRRIRGLRKNPAIALFLILVMSGGAYWLWNSRSFTTHPSRRVMLAVLPFENLTGVDSEEYLSDGVTEELTTQLARFDPGRLGVIAPSSAMRFKRQNQDLSVLGREFGVDYVVEGALRSDSQGLRITVRLVRVRDHTQVWAQGYDTDPKNLLSQEYTLAERTANALSGELRPAMRKRHAAAHRVKPEAREAYLRGRFLLSHRNSGSFENALKYFQEATEEESDYANAYAGIAECYLLLGNYRLLPYTVAMPKAKAAAFKALALDETLTEARLTLADIRWEFEWDIPGAGREFRRAVEGDPNDALAHQWYANYLASMGEFGAAIAELKKAVELDPVSPHTITDLGRVYYFARQYDLAIAQFRKALELEPNFTRAQSQLGLALLEKGKYDEALAELRTGMGGDPVGHSIWLGYAYARAGRETEARRQLAAQIEYWKKSHTGAGGIALTYAWLGEKDQAFSWLEKEFEAHGSIHMLKAWPYWDPLRSDPRYGDLLRRVGLSP